VDSLVIVSKAGNRLSKAGIPVKEVKIGGVPILLALIERKKPAFKPSDANRRHVLVEKIGFSANYRDKSWIMKYNHDVNESAGEDQVIFKGMGSDFVARVLEVGADVKTLQPGDRVISFGFAFENAMLPDTEEYKGSVQGCVTNEASYRFDIFHEKNVLKIPDSIPNETAAALNVNAVTGYSMVAKIDPKPGEHILVTAAKCNTSLYTIAALVNTGANVYGLSTSNRFEDKLKKMGMKELLVMDPQKETLKDLPLYKKIRAETPNFYGFHGVVDPFFDIYFGHVLDVMATAGRYTTCGLYNQMFHQFTGTTPELRQRKLNDVITIVMGRNLSIIGNNMGNPQGLIQAVKDCAEGKSTPPIDKVYKDDAIDDFFNRTYNSKDRFGKVVYLYE